MKELFAKHVSIRLADDGRKFVCTTKYGRFFSRSTEVSIECGSLPEPREEKAAVPFKRRSIYWLPAEE